MGHPSGAALNTPGGLECGVDLFTFTDPLWLRFIRPQQSGGDCFSEVITIGIRISNPDNATVLCVGASAFRHNDVAKSASREGSLYENGMYTNGVLSSTHPRASLPPKELD